MEAEGTTQSSSERSPREDAALRQTPSESGKAHGRRGVIVALVALVAVGLALGIWTMSSGTAIQPASESQAPANPDAEYIADFDATVFDEYGDARTITALADGKPLVMNFWATWCPYCVQEMGDYQQIYDEYSDRVSFAFIDVADGTRETVDGASSWLYENGFYLPAYYDTNLDAMYAYGATALPTTVVAAADGEILSITPGPIDADGLRGTLDSLLEG